MQLDTGFCLPLEQGLKERPLGEDGPPFFPQGDDAPEVDWEAGREKDGLLVEGEHGEQGEFLLVQGLFSPLVLGLETDPDPHSMFAIISSVSTSQSTMRNNPDLFWRAHLKGGRYMYSFVKGLVTHRID